MRMFVILRILQERTTSLIMDGRVRDILVKVGNLVIPTDFIIMNIKEDDDIPIILGRSFLTTACAIVDVKNRHISFNFEDKIVEFEQEDKGITYSSSNHHYDTHCIQYERNDNIRTTIMEGVRDTTFHGNQRGYPIPKF